jgi:hypothetical protein
MRQTPAIGIENVDKGPKSYSGKTIEYIHEEYQDAKGRGKWTVFNQHAVELDNKEDIGCCLQDSIIEDMKLNDVNQQKHVTNIPESTWHSLYQAKCLDLGIPSNSQKQQERFITQMRMHQKGDRICLKDQQMGFNSAEVIGKLILANNSDLLKIDLSNNQLQ